MCEKVYTIFYNYGEYEYTLVKIFNSIEKAFCYITLQENTYFYENKNVYKMVEINSQKELDSYNSDNECAICFVSSGKYEKIKFIDTPNVSQYIIVPINVE